MIGNNDGIYYISNGNLETQILVQKELSKTENEYLRVLTNQLDEKETLKQVMLEYDNESKNIAYRILLEVVTLANPNIVSEVMNEMRAQLTETNRAVLLNIAEELKLNKKWEEKGREQGKEEWREEGREESAIEALKLGLDIEVASKISKLPLEKVRELAKKLS